MTECNTRLPPTHGSCLTLLRLFLMREVRLEGCGIAVVIEGPRSCWPSVNVMQSSFQAEAALRFTEMRLVYEYL